MAKLPWNDFISKYKNGMCVFGTYSWKSPAGQQTTSGMKLPTVSVLMSKFLTKHMTDDWAISHKKSGKNSLIHIMLRSPTDLKQLSKFFSISSQNQSLQVACSSVCQFPFDQSDYGSIARLLGYK